MTTSPCFLWMRTARTRTARVYLYRYDNSTGSPVLDNIESDEEYDAVADMFDQMLDAAEYDEVVEADGEDVDFDETN